MSEERQNDERAPRAFETGGAAFAALGSGSRDAVDAFLKEQARLAREQTELARLQAEELRREDSVRHWSLRVHHIGDVLKLAFQLALALIFTAFVVLIGWVVWTAANDNSLIIDAFTVPPDMAARGLTGDVVASQLLDRLTQMQNDTDSSRAPSSYSSDWGGDIKVEIPDTGISIGQAYKYLAAALGHQTHITGEIYRTVGGIAFTARVGGNPGVTFDGREADLPKLAQAAAESIYHQTQPYRYAIFVSSTYRDPVEAQRKSDMVLKDLALNGPDSEKPWAYAVWSYDALADNDLPEALRRARKAVALAPDLPMAAGNLVTFEETAGHDEQALAAARNAISALKGSGRAMIIPRAAAMDDVQNAAFVAEATGDYGEALRQYERMRSLADFEGLHWNSVYMTAADLALAHDVKGSRAWDNEQNDRKMLVHMNAAFGWQLSNMYWPAYLQDAALDDWKAARKDIESLTAPDLVSTRLVALFARMQISPALAVADARMGDFSSAWATVNRTPLDCYRCLIARGQIAAAARDWTQADRWFAAAAKLAPSIPFAPADWGQMLLAKGDYDGAIAKFTSANRKGPHFADPLEMWGEALMQKNRSDLALAKFEEANKYAPNWGRLHLKWGQALLYTGDKAGARKQFAGAARLDLTPSEKSELAKMAAHG